MKIIIIPSVNTVYCWIYLKKFLAVFNEVLFLLFFLLLLFYGTFLVISKLQDNTFIDLLSECIMHKTVL
jgi:TRAP-type C4-dicarboxylate transport system permease small subunit